MTWSWNLRSISVPDERLDANMNSATSGRQNIARQAIATTSCQSGEPLQTNQRMEDVTSDHAPTSLGLEDESSGSVHSTQICKVETKRGILKLNPLQMTSQSNMLCQTP